jgi:hypothetical protein
MLKHSESLAMYGDEDHWPLKCSGCRHEFIENIERMLAESTSRCPECGLNLPRAREQFLAALAEARAGTFNPWRDMTILEMPR